MEKRCNNCKHAHKSYRDMPCLTCKANEHTNWEAKTDIAKEEKKNDDAE